MKKNNLYNSTVVLILAVVFVLSLSACAPKKDKLVGTWVALDYACDFDYIYFYSDGTYSSSHSNYKGSYTAEDGRLRLEGFLVDDRNYKYRFDGDILVIETWSGEERYERHED